MKPDLATLYILSDAPSGDPLDCVAAAMPFLAPHYAAIQRVGPSQALSVRALRRVYEPGLDRLLYDFTAPQDHGWAFGMLKDAPAAILLGCHSPTQGAALANLRSAQRYAADGLRFSPDATVGILDALADPATSRPVRRPAAIIAPSLAGNDLMMAVEQGAIETAYAALRGLIGNDAALTILTVSRRDANDLTDIIAAFGMAGASVRYARNRESLVTALGGCGGLIDVSDETGPALSDAAFVAGCIGAPVLTLIAPDGAGVAVRAFAASNPGKDSAAAAEYAAARPASAFANDLYALIEAGFTRAQQSVVAA